MRRVAILGLYDIGRPSIWSGIPFFFCRALTERPDIETCICNPYAPFVPSVARDKVRFYRERGERYLWTRDREWSIRGAQIATAALTSMDATNVLVFNPSDLAFLDTHLPRTVVVDASWRQYVANYHCYESMNFCAETMADALRGESLGFENATTILCLSRWAAAAIASEYPTHAHKIVVAAPGANLAQPPTTEMLAHYIQMKMRRPTYDVLFVGVAAYRKGFDLALKACEILVDMGIPITFHAVGFKGSLTNDLPDFARTYGPLSKASETDHQLLNNLFLTANLFLFPTRAECAGIVLAEAAAFGLPVICSGVGGSAEMFIDGITGIQVADHTSEGYARAMARLLSNAEREFAMSVASRLLYETTLNWGTVGQQLLSSWDS